MLRQWFGSDAEPLVPIANDPYIARYLSHAFPQPYTRADADRWLAEQARADTVGQFAIEVGGQLAGGTGFIRGRPERAGTASIGYWLGRRYWGRGVMTEALQAATHRVLEKAGYALEGRLPAGICDRRGLVHDDLIYGR